MRQFLILFIAIFMVGCSFRSVPKNGKEIEIVNGERIYTKSGSLSATAPNNFPKTPFEGYTRFDHDLINFERHLPNMMSEDVGIEVSDLPKEGLSRYLMLNREKNTDLEQIVKKTPMSDWERKNNAERGINYVKKYVDNIAGLKCMTRVESGNIALGIGRKSYQTNCNYFDLNGNPKLIHFDYHYVYTHKGTKYDGDTQSSSVSPEAMQIQFKEDMKAIFDSLVIHDMDRERMSKEGLLHDKKYEIQEW